MESEITVGSCVQLLNGSPDLLVEKIEDDEVTVVWFAGDNLRSRNFDRKLLKLKTNNISSTELARRIAFLLAKGVAESDSREDIGNITAVLAHLTEEK